MPEQQSYDRYALKQSAPILRGHRAMAAVEQARDQVTPEDYSDMLSRAQSAY